MKTVLIYENAETLSVGQGKNCLPCDPVTGYPKSKSQGGGTYSGEIIGIGEVVKFPAWNGSHVWVTVRGYEEIKAPLISKVVGLGYHVDDDPESRSFRVVGRGVTREDWIFVSNDDDIRIKLKPIAPEFPMQEFQVKIRTAEAVRSPSGRGMAVGVGTATAVPVSAWRTEHGLIAVSSSETGWTARRAEAAVALRLLRRKGIGIKMLSLSQRTERLIEFPIKNWRKAREAREAAIAAFDTAKAADEIRSWQRGMAEEFGNFASLHTAPGGMDMGPVGPQVFTAMMQTAHAACAAAERR